MARVTKKQIRSQKIWMEKIHRAKKVRASWRELFKVDQAREYLDGKQNPGFDKEDWITVNNFYAYLKSQLPAVYSQDPYFYVKLRRSYSPDPNMIPLWEQKGKMRSAYLNYLKEELSLKTKARLSIQDAQTTYGVVKVHHSSDMVDNSDAGRPILGEDDVPLRGDNDLPLIEPD